MNVNAINDFVFNPFIAREDMAKAIVGFAGDDLNLIPAGNQSLADGGDDNVFWVIILTDNQNSHNKDYRTD